jgi:hypothetical protein
LIGGTRLSLGFRLDLSPCAPPFRCQPGLPPSVPSRSPAACALEFGYQKLKPDACSSSSVRTRQLKQNSRKINKKETDKKSHREIQRSSLGPSRWSLAVELSLRCRSPGSSARATARCGGRRSARQPTPSFAEELVPCHRSCGCPLG